MQINAINNYANSNRAKNNQQSFGMAWRVQEKTLLPPEIHAIAKIVKKMEPLDACEVYVMGRNKGPRREIEVLVTKLNTRWQNFKSRFTKANLPNVESPDTYCPLVSRTHAKNAPVDEIRNVAQENINSALDHYESAIQAEEIAQEALDQSLATIKEASK